MYPNLYGNEPVYTGIFQIFNILKAVLRNVIHSEEFNKSHLKNKFWIRNIVMLIGR
jgi:hypothetical protein